MRIFCPAIATAAEQDPVTEIARTIGVSRRSLEIRFQRSLATSVYAQVQRVRFKRVVELMNDRAMTLDEIAYNTGFGGAATFSTMFRRHFKVAPSVYRMRMRQESQYTVLRKT